MSSIERLLERSRQHGVESLSTADLFTLILCGRATITSKQREKVLQQIEQFLAERGETVPLLGIDVGELLDAGLNETLATRLVALLELYRRLAQPSEPRYQIRCPDDAAKLVMPQMRALKQEQMRVLVLDTKSRLIANILVYRGTVNSGASRMAELFRPAIVRNCPSIILCHNHPSGMITPSREDFAFSEQAVRAGKALDIEVNDHLIIGDGKYTSMRELLHW